MTIYSIYMQPFFKGCLAVSSFQTYTLHTITHTQILDDPSGNSFVENQLAPSPNPDLTTEFYPRSEEQNRDLGLLSTAAEVSWAVCFFFVFFSLSSYWELVDSLPYCPGQPLMGACSSSAKNRGWPVTWRRCLNGSTFLAQKPTLDVKLAARVYQISLHRHFVRASSRKWGRGGGGAKL